MPEYSITAIKTDPCSNRNGTRLRSLDVFRGITVALMILVNSPGNRTPWSWLEHSAWNGCTAADLVFPFFIVILGISAVLALTGLRAKGSATPALFAMIFKRSGYIFLAGVLLNIFPHHFDLNHLRFLGVLQRIAICYFVSASLFLVSSCRTQACMMLSLLVIYGCLPLLPGVDAISQTGNLAGYIDRIILKPEHMYRPGFDPEGLLSTIPAIASVLLGNLIGFCLISSRSPAQKRTLMLVPGVLITLAGGVWGQWLPINKSLWSSSYVLWTGGLALVFFSGLYQLIEIKQKIRWAFPFELFGRHAMLVYLLHVIFLKIQVSVLVQTGNGSMMNIQTCITKTLFHDFSPQNAALAYAILYTLIWLPVLIILTPGSLRKVLTRPR